MKKRRLFDYIVSESLLKHTRRHINEKVFIVNISTAYGFLIGFDGEFLSGL